MEPPRLIAEFGVPGRVTGWGGWRQEALFAHTPPMRRLLIGFSLFLATSLNAQHFAAAGDGVRLWYADSGKGSPVIVIHGGPGMDHDSLAADLAPLRLHHRVIESDQHRGGP